MLSIVPNIVNHYTLSCYYSIQHFQGHTTKSLMYVYGRIFEILLDPIRVTPSTPHASFNNNNNSTRATVEVGFAGGIILRPEASKKLYYVFPNATRYRFTSWEEVVSVGLDKTRVYPDVPFEIITVFPPVHAHHNE